MKKSIFHASDHVHTQSLTACQHTMESPVNPSLSSVSFPFVAAGNTADVLPGILCFVNRHAADLSAAST